MKVNIALFTFLAGLGLAVPVTDQKIAARQGPGTTDDFGQPIFGPEGATPNTQGSGPGGQGAQGFGEVANNFAQSDVGQAIANGANQAAPAAGGGAVGGFGDGGFGNFFSGS
ncbi:hypothetical protein HIM_12326 [Hirsutella minnesotensis 3608]|uniref:Uncharacterized protein n=1 Tax=Hirsutella minnesotensis 3608 TaxID=1043627 RepID=A0A0F7ZF01_9HYPO|nr:hypothetical protein HIM_12326 [Hirsutella minnesotensis 3608]